MKKLIYFLFSCSISLFSMSGRDRTADSISYHIYPSSVAAFQAILERENPLVIGFGEYHQLESNKETVSAIKRFTRSIVPLIAPLASDLIVETWIKDGECGEVEEDVVADIEETTERPAETENEVVELIFTAKKAGIQPHVLELSCAEYEGLKDTADEVDYYALMELVARKMELKMGTLIDSGLIENKKFFAIYGGALHNDMAPIEEIKTLSFASVIKEKAKGRYLEVDLYVPEFIENDEDLIKEAWYPIFRRYSDRDK